MFPVAVGDKRPLGGLAPRGLHDATIDIDVIRAWWRAVPNANIGLPTGHHFDVLDVDGPAALDALEGSGPLGDPDVEGPTVATRGGGIAMSSRPGAGTR